MAEVFTELAAGVVCMWFFVLKKGGCVGGCFGFARYAPDVARNGVREAPEQPLIHPPFCMNEAWTIPPAIEYRANKPATQAARPAVPVAQLSGAGEASPAVGVRRVLTKGIRGMSSAAV